MSGKKDREPMDSGVPEVPVDQQRVARSRTCYAAKTLIAEVLELFPETEYEITDYNDRSVGLGVRFRTANQPGLYELLGLVESDLRVLEVTGDSQSLRILFRNWARTQDLRDPFGLDEAWDILEDDDGEIIEERDAWGTVVIYNGPEEKGS